MITANAYLEIYLDMTDSVCYTEEKVEAEENLLSTFLAGFPPLDCLDGFRVTDCHMAGFSSE